MICSGYHLPWHTVIRSDVGAATLPFNIRPGFRRAEVYRRAVAWPDERRRLPRIVGVAGSQDFKRVRAWSPFSAKACTCQVASSGAVPSGTALDNALAPGGGDLATSACKVPPRPASNLKCIAANNAGSPLGSQKQLTLLGRQKTLVSLL